MQYPKMLEERVTERTLHIISWDWMSQFPPHETSGKTKISEWELVLRYSTFARIPKIAKTYQGRKGPIHLTNGVNPKHFPALSR